MTLPPAILALPKRFIPEHRSVRRVAFHPKRLAAGALLSGLLCVSLYTQGTVIAQAHARLVSMLLEWAKLPFSHGYGGQLGIISIASWQVDSFNPMGDPTMASLYVGGTLMLFLLAILVPKWPFPIRAWLGMGSLMLLTTEIVLFFKPIPRFTPESFSVLWGQVAVGTLVLFPAIWSLLVGVIPIPIFRIILWGISAQIVMFAFSACRLAFCLAFAHFFGVLWLPIAFVLFCSIFDFLVMVVFFAQALEQEGPRWAGRS